MPYLFLLLAYSNCLESVMVSSVVILAKIKGGSEAKFSLILYGRPSTKWVNKVRYLGHIIRNDSCDDDNVQSQCSKLYACQHAGI